MKEERDWRTECDRLDLEIIEAEVELRKRGMGMPPTALTEAKAALALQLIVELADVSEAEVDARLKAAALRMMRDALAADPDAGVRKLIVPERADGIVPPRRGGKL